jgi:hypothetical protein
MRILTLDNQCFKLDKLPEELEEDVRFAVLDNSNPKDPDFFWIPLIFLESFNAPAMVLRINGHEIAMPVDWSMAIGCSDTGNDIEVLPLTSINDRGFEAFLFNPLTGFRVEFEEFEIVNFYSDVKWYFPKMKNGQLLAVPISDGPAPLCAYFVKDISRQCEVVSYSDLF